jgi:uncharacterized protein YigA (DUF484 family)
MSGDRERTASGGAEEEREPAVSERQVADYLLRHPDFFLAHADVLAGMRPPERRLGERVIDMQRFMLDRRDREIAELRECALEVIETSRSNMSVQTRTHASVLALLSAGDFAHLVRVIVDDLPILLDVDVVAIGFEPADGAESLLPAELKRLPRGEVDRLLGADRNVALRNGAGDGAPVFGPGAGLVRSSAFARLRPGPKAPPGLLALGSRGAAFHPGQGTELVSFLARVVESCVERTRSRRA